MMMRTRDTSGFTIIEILVVITITVLLLGLILGPVIQSFNLTHKAQVMTEAQETARNTLEVLQREMSQAMFVYDNTNSPISMRVPDPSDLYNLTDQPMVPVKYAKIDFVLPKLMMHCNNQDHPASEPRDYERGDKAWPSCPYCGSDNVEARPLQPLQQDPKIVRYFIGLKNPGAPFADSVVMKDLPSEVPENPYVLYRVEFSVNDEEDPLEIDSHDLFPAGMPVSDRLHWEDFFYSTESGANGDPIWENWKKIAQVVGPSQDIEMLAFNTTGTAPSAVWTPVPAVRFMPTGVDNDTLTPTYLSDNSAESPSAVPTVFRATHGHWGPDFRVQVFNGDYSDWYYSGFDADGHLMVYNRDGTPVFDVTQYQITGAFGGGGLDMMFNVDPNKGEVTFSFPAITSMRVEDIEAAFRDQYEQSLNETGIGVGERSALIGGPVGGSIPNAKMVPGSEEVRGPDMTPGPNYGRQMVRYERVPLALGDPGLNQYKIDYDYKPDDPNDRHTARIWFTSDPNTPIPFGVAQGIDSFEIKYQFHNNGPDQIVKADYDTKNLITVSLAIRLYDEASDKPIVVELSDQVNVRNIAR